MVLELPPADKEGTKQKGDERCGALTVIWFIFLAMVS